MTRCLVMMLLPALVPALALDLAAAGRLPAGTELVELRAPGARHFSNGDGTIRAELGCWPGGGTDVPDTLVAVTAGFTEYWLAMGIPLYVSTPASEMKMWNFAVLWILVYSRPWAEWNTASIPDSVTVDRVTLRLFGSDMMGFTPINGIEIHEITCRPSVYAYSQSADTAQALYDDCGDGPTYVSAGCPRDFTWHEYRLSRDAARCLEERLADNWFAIGVKSLAPPGPFSWARYVGLDSSWQFRPKLIVDYACAGIAEQTGPVPRGRGFALSPNPARGGRVTMSYALAPGARAEARVYDAAGREVRRLALPARAGEAELDVSGLESGVYLVRAGGRGEGGSCRLTVVGGGAR